MERILLRLEQKQTDALNEVLDFLNKDRDRDKYANVATLCREWLANFAFGKAREQGSSTLGQLYGIYAIKGTIDGKAYDLKADMASSITEKDHNLAIPAYEKLVWRLRCMVPFVNKLNEHRGVKITFADCAELSKDVVLSRLAMAYNEMVEKEAEEEEKAFKDSSPDEEKEAPIKKE
jgi:hypothetical protein